MFCFQAWRPWAWQKSTALYFAITFGLQGQASRKAGPEDRSLFGTRDIRFQPIILSREPVACEATLWSTWIATRSQV
ncbi:hypothetical protein FPV67DRAFT_1495844 [Lyophyllum atratum]|nr:hypothetical protein FPV67DRAFT_1495844 [Lyophyllum atratum]